MKTINCVGGPLDRHLKREAAVLCVFKVASAFEYSVYYLLEYYCHAVEYSWLLSNTVL